MTFLETLLSVFKRRQKYHDHGISKTLEIRNVRVQASGLNPYIMPNVYFPSVYFFHGAGERSESVIALAKNYHPTVFLKISMEKQRTKLSSLLGRVRVQPRMPTERAARRD